MNNACGICGRNRRTQLRSSGCAPVTIQACDECISRGAESADIAATWLFFHGGIDGAPDYKYGIIIYNNGQYCGWDELKEFYKINANAIAEEFRGDGQDERLEPEIDLKDESVDLDDSK